MSKWTEVITPWVRVLVSLSSNPQHPGKNLGVTRFASAILAVGIGGQGLLALSGSQPSSTFSEKSCLKEIKLSVIQQDT